MRGPNATEYPEKTVELRYKWYFLKKCDLQRLIYCIVEGDGAPLTLENDIMHSENVTENEKFSYKKGVFPPYGRIKGHWYLLCWREQDDEVRFLSFFNSQREITAYLCSCDFVFLYYVPPCIVVPAQVDGGMA